MRVTWSIEVKADSVRDAARQALAIFRNVDTRPLVFEVTDRYSTTPVDASPEFEIERERQQKIWNSIQE